MQLPSNGDQVGNLRHYLHSKGMSDDDVRTACDLATKNLARGLRGGPFPFDEEKESDTLDPAKDQSTCLEEDLGHEPYRPRGDRRLAGDAFERFPELRRIESVWGFSPLEHERETARSQRLTEQREARRTGRTRQEMALDQAAAKERFDELYPDIAASLARIKTGMF